MQQHVWQGQQKTRRTKAKAGLSESDALASICNAPQQAENQIGANFTIRSCSILDQA
jgi:hypothetical protein